MLGHFFKESSVTALCITILHSEKWYFKIPSPLGLMIISYISNRPDHAEVKHQDETPRQGHELRLMAQLEVPEKWPPSTHDLPWEASSWKARQTLKKPWCSNIPTPFTIPEVLQYLYDMTSASKWPYTPEKLRAGSAENAGTSKFWISSEKPGCYWINPWFSRGFFTEITGSNVFSPFKTKLCTCLLLQNRSRSLCKYIRVYTVYLNNYTGYTPTYVVCTHS